MQYVTSFERRGLKKGIAQGHKQGLQQGLLQKSCEAVIAILDRDCGGVFRDSGQAKLFAAK